jgi:hypothetical protein
MADQPQEPHAPDADTAPGIDVDPNQLVNSTDSQLDAIFRRSSTLPLDQLMNAGQLDVDLASHTIYNDANWKGWVPQDLPLNGVFARLSTGYAKRFWKRRKQVLGETLYLSGRLLVKHALEEVTIDRVTNDLDPGRYILLRYTDPVFEHVFYDVVRALSSGVILYRGYTGQFPEGRRGLTGLLMRRYTFAQMGVEDHKTLFSTSPIATPDSLAGAWHLSVIDTSNHAVGVAQVSFDRNPDGRLQSRCEAAVGSQSPLVPPFVFDHFRTEEFTGVESELRTIDDQMVIGRWTTDIRGPYAKLLLVGTQGLFHAESEKGSRGRFTLYYMLTRAAL